MTEHTKSTWISIWSWVGYVLLMYGVIITGCGVYYAMTELPKTVMGESNPSLWWGAIMLAGGVVFMLVGRHANKLAQE